MLDEVLDLFGWAPPARPRPNASAGTAAAGTGHARTPSEPARLDPPPHCAPPRPSSPAPTGRSEAEVLAVIARVTPQFRRVMYTRNRRTMASTSEQGHTLRLNVAFAEAQDDVLAAVARLFTDRDARKRGRARALVRAFIRGIPADSTAPRRRPRTRRLEPGDERHVERLRAEFRRVNAECFGEALPEVPLFLSGQMRRRNGHFSSAPLEIVISRRLCTHAVPGEAEATLRHEMIHLWQHAEGRKLGHGTDFRAWARRLDVHPRATRPVIWKNQARG